MPTKCYDFVPSAELVKKFANPIHSLEVIHQLPTEEEHDTDSYKQVRVKKFVPNKKEDIGMEVYYLCQPNTCVIAREFGEQQ